MPCALSVMQLYQVRICNTVLNLLQLKYKFSILHFNDVYEIAEREKEPVAGAARFAFLVKEKIAEAERKYGERPLVVFSGDCLNPSTLSCATLGKHMVEILNNLGVSLICNIILNHWTSDRTYAIVKYKLHDFLILIDPYIPYTHEKVTVALLFWTNCSHPLRC